MRILYLSRWFPYPADNGSRLRTAALLAALADGHEVDLISFVETQPGEADLAAARAICHAVQVVPYTRFAPRSWDARLRYLAPEPRSVGSTFSAALADAVRVAVTQRTPDVIVAGQIDMAPYATAHQSIPLILEELELGLRLAPDAVNGRGWRTQLSAWKLRRYLHALLPRFAAITVVSPREAALAQAVAPACADRLRVVPNGVALPTDAALESLPKPQPDTLLYPGAVTYHANLDAVRFFANEILPRIRSARPAVRLRVTGRTDDVNLNEFPPEVEFTGYLPTVAPLLAASWAVVVPLRIGGGSRIKVLEAMARGVPVIATPKGVEGIELEAGRDALVAGEPADFADATLRLLGDAELRAALAASARRAVAAYDWKRIGPLFRSLVEEAASGRAAIGHCAQPQTQGATA